MSSSKDNQDDMCGDDDDFPRRVGQSNKVKPRELKAI